MKLKNIILLTAAMSMTLPVVAQDEEMGTRAGVTLKPFHKKASNCNPLSAFNLCADPTAVEYEGRLYVYGTNDQLEFDTGDKTNNTYGKINQLVCMSTDDLVNWTFHGIIDVKKVCSWCWTSWAPSITSRVEKDGKTHFYMYFTNGASGIGMMTATSPLGPWTDPLGRALIDGSTKGKPRQSNIIDPGVCIDDEGNGWLTFGGGDPQNGNRLSPGNAYIVKLGANMKSFASDFVYIPAPYHFEANELNFIDGQWIFSYSGGWSTNAGEWSGYAGKGSYPCPGTCSILSMSSTDPLSGEWTYTGELLKNPGSFGYPWGNNHSHVEKFGNTWYMIYHTQELVKSWGYSSGYRCIGMNKITYNEKTKKFNTATMSGTGLTQISGKRINPFEKIQAETMSNTSGLKATNATSPAGNTTISKLEDGSWIQLRGVNFDKAAKSVTLRIKGTGTLEFRTGSSNGSIANSSLASVDFDSKSLRIVTLDLSKEIAARNHNYFYLVFSNITKAVELDYYYFNELSVDELTPIEEVAEEAVPVTQAFFSLDGRRLPEKPERGMFIRREVMTDGSQRSTKEVR